MVKIILGFGSDILGSDKIWVKIWFCGSNYIWVGSKNISVGNILVGAYKRYWCAKMGWKLTLEVPLPQQAACSLLEAVGLLFTVPDRPATENWGGFLKGERWSVFKQTKVHLLLSHLGSGYFFRTLYLSTGPKGLPRSFSASCSKTFIRIWILRATASLARESFSGKTSATVWRRHELFEIGFREQKPAALHNKWALKWWWGNKNKLSRGKQSKLRRIRSLVGELEETPADCGSRL